MRMPRILSCAVTMQMLWMLAGCCGEDFIVNYQWRAMTLGYLDNSGPQLRETTGDQLPAGAYGIRMRLEEEESVASLLPILPVARATSCIDNYIYINRDTILDIRIHSLSAAGSTPREVTGDFIVQKNKLDGIESFMTIPELIRSMNERQTMLPEWVDLIRTKGTEEASPLRFIVTMEQASGRALTDTTDSVTLI